MLTRSSRFVPLIALAACLPSDADVAGRANPDAPLPTRSSPPQDPDTAACWADTGTPAVLATLEDEVVVEPAGLAADGTLREDPVTKIERLDLVVEPGSQVWFEILCPADLPETRIAALQRSLAVRGYYDGPVTGQLDDATGAAVRSFQAPLGIDSPALSRAAAERLGLVVVARPG